MADDVDITTEREEKMMAQMRLQVPVNELDPIGYCHWCGEKIERPKKFCDSDCASDHEANKRLNRYRSTNR